MLMKSTKKTTLKIVRNLTWTVARQPGADEEHEEDHGDENEHQHRCVTTLKSGVEHILSQERVEVGCHSGRGWSV